MAALIKGAAELLLTVLKKPAGLTFVVIQDVELEDWGVDTPAIGAWKSVAQFRACGGMGPQRFPF
jgi:phenylpyruvate tautomerase PptA (4-oxalocrotonate tautomerase family)